MSDLALTELLGLHDRRFVGAAFRQVLGRDPTTAELEHHLGRHRRGESDRVGLVLELQSSAEAKGRAVTVTIPWPLAVYHRVRRIPLLGLLVRCAVLFVHAPRNLPAIDRTLGVLLQQQDEQAASADRAIASLAQAQREQAAVAERMLAAERARQADLATTAAARVAALEQELDRRTRESAAEIAAAREETRFGLAKQAGRLDRLDRLFTDLTGGFARITEAYRADRETEATLRRTVQATVATRLQELQDAAVALRAEQVRLARQSADHEIEVAVRVDRLAANHREQAQRMEERAAELQRTLGEELVVLARADLERATSLQAEIELVAVALAGFEKVTAERSGQLQSGINQLVTGLTGVAEASHQELVAEVRRIDARAAEISGRADEADARTADVERIAAAAGVRLGSMVEMVEEQRQSFGSALANLSAVTVERVNLLQADAERRIGAQIEDQRQRVELKMFELARVAAEGGRTAATIGAQLREEVAKIASGLALLESASAINFDAMRTDVRDEASRKAAELSTEVDRLRSEAESGRSALGVRLGELAMDVQEIGQLTGWTPITTAPSAGFYQLLEDRYRGPRELIRDRMRSHVEAARRAFAATGITTALDLGCGRGEWLELMLECGAQVSGIDQDQAMVDRCRALDLPVRQGEALAVLSTVPSGSLAVLTAFHVVEHITFDQVLGLIKEARRVLAPNGVLILETPNPLNVLVASYSFRLDPTHRFPIPHLLLDLAAEFAGFTNRQVVLLHPRENPADIQGGDLAVRWNDFFHCGQDYVLYAT